MNVNATLEASAQLAEGGQPGMGALNDPAMAAQAVIALDPLAGDAILDACAFEVSTASRVVVALVRMQFSRPSTRPASLATYRRQGIDQLLEDHRVMPVGPGDAEHHRDALSVRDDVVLAAKLAPIRRVGACVRPPGGWARWLRPC